MSSHHIVREKQEPALLVLGLDNFPDELLGQLLEWSPTVIATPQIAEKLNAFGIKIDWIIIDGEYEAEQSDIKLMPAGDGNLARAALQYLITNGYPAVNIITDEPNLNDFAHVTEAINLVIFYDNKKIFPVVPGFSKWKPAGETIEVLTTAGEIHATGLEKTGPQVYKTISDGFYSLNFDATFLFIAETL